jgi:hydrogenase-4 component E
MALIGIVLSSFSFLALSRLHLSTVSGLPLSALAVAVAVVLIAFLLMVVRPFAPSQVLGFLVLENGASLAGIAIAPGLPLILALLLLFDVFIGVLVFVVLVQYLGVQSSTVHTGILDRLRG